MNELEKNAQETLKLASKQLKFLTMVTNITSYIVVGALLFVTLYNIFTEGFSDTLWMILITAVTAPMILVSMRRKINESHESRFLKSFDFIVDAQWVCGTYHDILKEAIETYPLKEKSDTLIESYGITVLHRNKDEEVTEFMKEYDSWLSDKILLNRFNFLDGIKNNPNMSFNEFEALRNDTIERMIAKGKSKIDSLFIITYTSKLDLVGLYYKNEYENLLEAIENRYQDAIKHQNPQYELLKAMAYMKLGNNEKAKISLQTCVNVANDSVYKRQAGSMLVDLD
ncbi:MAG: hypothetical protein RR565_09095 [Erysipelothrix sp.]